MQYNSSSALNGQQVKKRKEWVDALRAIAMLFVVYGHRVGNWTEYFVFTSSVKISMFFAISGYVFNYSNTNTKTFFSKLLRGLIIPWLVLGIAPIIALTPFNGTEYFVERLIAFITGKSVWYMPCCIVAEIFWYCANKYIKRIDLIILYSVGMFVIGQILFSNDVFNIFMINRAFSAQLFLCMGLLISRYEKSLLQAKVTVIIILSLMYIGFGVLTLIQYPGKSMDIHMNQYYSYAICLIMTAVGLVLMFSVFKMIGSFPKAVLFLGRNTLPVFMLQGYVSIAYIVAAEKIGIPYENKLISFFASIVIISICCLASWIISLICPQILGRKKLTKHE